MSEHDVNTIVELIRIFAMADEETRNEILAFGQKLIEHPDLLNQAS